MFRNYLKIAFRNLYKNKLYSSVNIIGLTVGISSCLLIGVYILHELSYDRFHANAKRIVRVTMDYNFSDAATQTAYTGTKVGPQFKRTFSEVESYARILKYARAVTYKMKSFEEPNFLYADSAFLSMFSFPLLLGNASTALNTPDKIVLTRSTALKYFGKEQPIGKVLRVGENKDFIVTGVIADAPPNSQIRYDLIASFTSLNASKTEKYNEANYVTYLLLDQNVNIKGLQKKISSYMQLVSAKELNVTGSNYLTYHLEPLTSVYLHSALTGFEPNNNIVYIYILGIVAFLILCIASVNYMNLATAQSAGRTGEIGIRKVLGAHRIHIFRQFIGESMFLLFIAIILSLLLSVLLLPFFNQLAGKQLEPSVFFHPIPVSSLLMLGILVAFASGSYPAVILSNIHLIKVLKSGFSFSSRGTALRKSLIVLQFVISIFLIICTLVVVQQLEYIKSKDLGYDKDQVLVLPLDSKMSSGYENLKSRLLGQPGVLRVGAAYEEPTDIGWSDGIRVGSSTQNVSVNALPVDEDFIETLGMSIIAGSGYTDADVKRMDTTRDEDVRYSFILNETAARAIGWKPEQAVGKSIAKNREGVVKGVVRDFHFRSMHEEIRPLVIFLDRNMVQKMFIKINARNVETTMSRLEMIWKQYVTHRPFEYHFLDEDYAALYKTEQRTATIFTAFSSLAIILACLGLFALTAYAVVQRTKEIGIRKVLGATIVNIISLLSKDFLVLIVVAIVIATPVAWLAADRWLQDFTYRINIGWWVVFMAGAATILIAILTVSFQAIKAALANPMRSLRTE